MSFMGVDEFDIYSPEKIMAKYDFPYNRIIVISIVININFPFIY